MNIILEKPPEYEGIVLCELTNWQTSKQKFKLVFLVLLQQ